jgi:hypothetical protein
MVVVLAIIIVITGVVINGQSTYNESLILTDTAYTVAFSVRQAQSLGLASRATNVGSTIVSNAGYGVRFAGATGYTVFADTGGPTSLGTSVCPTGAGGTPEESKPGNCKYDPGTDRIVSTNTFSRQFTIGTLCGKVSGGATCTPVTSIDAVFMRPETRAILTGPAGQVYSCIEVHVKAPTGNATRVVRVSQLGEISVGQSCP